MTPDALAALHGACFHRPPPWQAADFAALLADPASVFVTAGVDGFALGRCAADEAELLTLAVAPSARQRGHGRRLLSAFEAEAARRGAACAFLEVAADNDAARALYAGQGYSVVGRRPNLYSAPDAGRMDALVMRRALEAAIPHTAMRSESG